MIYINGWLVTREALEHFHEFLAAGLAYKDHYGYYHFLPLCNDETDLA